MTLLKKLKNYILIFAASLAVVACNGSLGIDSEEAGLVNSSKEKTLSLTVSTASTGALKNKVALASATIDSAKILVKNLKLHGDDGDSLDFKTGSFVMTLTPDTVSNIVAVNNIPLGTYKKFSFKIHKPEEGETILDSVFVDGPQGNQRYSIVIFGTKDGEEFQFKNRDPFKQQARFNPDLIIDEQTNQQVNVSLVVDINSWLVDENGQELDPTNPNDEKAIRRAIKRSFKAFKDANRDGRKDDDDRDDDSDDDEIEIEKSFVNTGANPDASGEAEFKLKNDETSFKVEVEDLAAGDFDLLINGEKKATIRVIRDDDGTEGEVEFRNPKENGKLLLDFDPRGTLIEIAQNGVVFLSIDF